MKTWITKDGRELIIAEMSINQINKLVNQLTKSSDPMAKKYIKVFNKELDARKTKGE